MFYLSGTGVGSHEFLKTVQQSPGCWGSLDSCFLGQRQGRMGWAGDGAGFALLLAQAGVRVGSKKRGANRHQQQEMREVLGQALRSMGEQVVAWQPGSAWGHCCCSLCPPRSLSLPFLVLATLQACLFVIPSHSLMHWSVAFPSVVVFLDFSNFLPPVMAC